MLFVLFAIAGVGHLVLWIALVNRLHGTALKRDLMDALTALCGLGVTLLPLAVFLVLRPTWWSGHSTSSHGRLGFLEVVAWAYVWGCAAIAIAAALHRLWLFLHPERRRTILRHQSTLLPMANGSAGSLASAMASQVAARRPSSVSELSMVEGIGDTKLERHGESLLAALAMAMESDNAPAA